MPVNAQQLKRLASRLFDDPGYIFWQIRSQLLYKAMEPYARLSRGRGFHQMVVVTFFLTWECNLRCVMCNLWGDHGSCHLPGNHSREVMAPQEWVRVVRELQPFGAEILLTGGEPLLYKKWDHIAEAAKHCQLKVSLISNGTLFERYLPSILDFVDRINVSIDGPEEVHDIIRKQKGHYQKVKRGVELIHREKQKRRQSTPYINIACTVQEKNQASLAELADELALWKASLNALIFQHQEFIGEEGMEKSEKIYGKLGQDLEIWRGFTRIPEMDLDLLIAQKKKLLAKAYPFRIFFFPPFDDQELRRYYAQPSSFVHSNSKRCIGPWVEALITPEGNFWICPDYPTGNVKQASIRTLWNNEKAARFRMYLNTNGPLAPVCRACQCFYNR